MSQVVLVFVGGGFGCICRYLLGREISRYISGNFPFATLTINLMGCLLIGLLYAFSTKYNLTQSWRLLLTTGFCGGFTTFSTLSYENYSLLISGNSIGFFLYSSLSFVVGLAAVFWGTWLGERL